MPIKWAASIDRFKKKPCSLRSMNAAITLTGFQLALSQPIITVGQKKHLTKSQTDEKRHRTNNVWTDFLPSNYLLNKCYFQTKQKQEVSRRSLTFVDLLNSLPRLYRQIFSLIITDYQNKMKPILPKVGCSKWRLIIIDIHRFVTNWILHLSCRHHDYKSARTGKDLTDEVAQWKTMHLV